MAKKNAREYEKSKEPRSKLNARMLRERLQVNVPLQKLYEAVYFDNFSMAA